MKKKKIRALFNMLINTCAQTMSDTRNCQIMKRCTVLADIKVIQTDLSLHVGVLFFSC